MKTLSDEKYKAVMIGGNHLANWLLGQDCDPANQMHYTQVLHDFKSSDIADVWIAWRRIMDMRNEVEGFEEPNPQILFDELMPMAIHRRFLALEKEVVDLRQKLAGLGGV